MKIRYVLFVFAVLLCGALPASAQATFIYAFNQQGLVSTNAYPLDSLPHGNSSNDQLWWDLFVQGPDRWLIRGDGKLALNGAVIQDLEGSDNWRGIVVDDSGTFFAMKSGGRVNNPSGTVVDYSQGNFYFSDIETDGVNVYVLKTNGSVFHVPDADQIIKFNGPGSDGDSSDKIWIRIHVNPMTGQMWALRQDGILLSAAIPPSPPMTPDEGTSEAALDFDSGSENPEDEFYYDFTFDADGSWYALRADGHLFSSAQPSPALVNFPGAPDDNVGNTYESVIVEAGQTLVLRQDGKAFKDLSTDAITDLKNSLYLKLALGHVFPNLTNVKNQPPTGSSVSLTAPVGTDIELPVAVVDRDLASADLVVDVVAGTLPAGATFDQVTRIISWPDAGPVGKYKVKLTVSDGIAKPVNITQSIAIKALDANGTKNIKPSIASVKNAVALVALPYELQVLAYDLDGTVPTLSLDQSKPLPAGVSFDALTGTLHWDNPLVEDQGTTSFKFIATDGTASVSRTIKVKVETSLLGF